MPRERSTSWFLPFLDDLIHSITNDILTCVSYHKTRWFQVGLVDKSSSSTIVDVNSKWLVFSAKLPANVMAKRVYADEIIQLRLIRLYTV